VLSYRPTIAAHNMQTFFSPGTSVSFSAVRQKNFHRGLAFDLPHKGFS
jgi:hypothetical protein